MKRNEERELFVRPRRGTSWAYARFAVQAGDGLLSSCTHATQRVAFFGE